jgi:hypothetical protein
LNSKDIYRIVVGELANEFRAQGYERLKGTFPSWTKRVNGRSATVWFQVATQGGEFTIEFQYGLTPQPGAGKWSETRRRRFFALLDDSEQRQVTRKFPKGGLTTNDDYWFLATNREMVLAVAEWFKTKMDVLVTRIVTEASDIQS